MVSSKSPIVMRCTVYLPMVLEKDLLYTGTFSADKNATEPLPCRRVANLSGKCCSYFLLTAFFSSTPGLNLATRRAAILMTPPVCGLRPLRALRCEVEKVPKPTRVTRSPFFSAAVTASTTVSSAPPAAVLLMPLAAAILSTRSPLFMLAPRRQLPETCREYLLANPAACQGKPEKSCFPQWENYFLDFCCAHCRKWNSNSSGE